MSKWLDFSEAIKTRIQAVVAVCATTLPDDQRVDVIVDRQLDINTRVTTAVAKASGAAVTILWLGGKNPQPDQSTLALGGSYRISIIGLPVINDAIAGRVPLDELTEQVCEAIHGFQPTARPTRLRETLRVLDVDLAPDPKLLVYEITADVKRL